MQGTPTESLDIKTHGVVGDRNWALFDLEGDRVISAKRLGRLLDARVESDAMILPDGTRIVISEAADGTVCVPISEWLGRPVRVCSTDDISELGDGHLTYQMTFDPPNDDSEYYDIPMPEGSFVDLAALHLVTTATLDGCRLERPDLNWDVRRFRPNLLIDTEGERFTESTWVGRPIRVGAEVVVEVSQPTVRCAMPLRHQPSLGEDFPELDRQRDLYQAMVDLRPEMPNHLGVYVNVLQPGTVRVGDSVEFV